VRSRQASVFFGNIAFDCDDDEIRRILRSTGPFSEMKLIMEGNKPRGYGFCTYNDADVATSALRNLNKQIIHTKEMKVSFGKDKQSGVNLL